MSVCVVVVVLTLTFMCPEVGFEFSLDALPLRKDLDRLEAKVWLRRSHYEGGGSRGRVRTEIQRGIPKKRSRSHDSEIRLEE